MAQAENYKQYRRTLETRQRNFSRKLTLKTGKGQSSFKTYLKSSLWQVCRDAISTEMRHSTERKRGRVHVCYNLWSTAMWQIIAHTTRETLHTRANILQIQPRVGCTYKTQMYI